MSSPPTSSSSALPSPSRRTAPVSSRSSTRVVFGPGQVQAVPEASRVSTAQVSPAVWSQALQRARGPPTLAWCQANGPVRAADWVPARFCGMQGLSGQAQGLFSGAAMASVLRVGGAGLGVRLVVEEDGEGAPAASGGGARRRANGGGGRANASPPVFEGGPSGMNVFSPGSRRLLPSITIRQGPLEISCAEVHRLREEVEGLREEVRMARQERDKVAQARDVLLRDRDVSLELLEAQAEEVKQLRARLTQGAAGSSTGTPGFVAPSAQEVEAMARGLHQADESESRRHDWLLREVAAARLETL
ncbi:hypothetical protein C0992_009346, partial [Termitomyces sp. T32_za158]